MDLVVRKLPLDGSVREGDWHPQASDSHSRARFYVTCTSPPFRLGFETRSDALADIKVWDIKLKLGPYMPDVSAVDMILSLQSIKLDDDWEGVSFGLQDGTELTVHVAADTFDFRRNNDTAADSGNVGQHDSPRELRTRRSKDELEAAPVDSSSVAIDFSADISSLYPDHQARRQAASPPSAGKGPGNGRRDFGAVEEKEAQRPDHHQQKGHHQHHHHHQHQSVASHDKLGGAIIGIDQAQHQQHSLLAFFRQDLNRATSRLRVEIGLRQEAQRQVAALRKELSDAIHHRSVAEALVAETKSSSGEAAGDATKLVAELQFELATLKQSAEQEAAAARAMQNKLAEKINEMRNSLHAARQESQALRESLATSEDRRRQLLREWGEETEAVGKMWESDKKSWQEEKAGLQREIDALRAGKKK